MKKTYKITFRAELSEDDVRAMNKYFYDTMNESMQIEKVWGLEMEELDSEELAEDTDVSDEEDEENDDYEEDDDYCGLGEELGKKLIDLFWDGLSGWTWKSWCDAGSVDKEEIVAEALSALPDVFRISASEERVYDLFWEWASGLEEDAFEDEADTIFDGTFSEVDVHVPTRED